MFFLVELRSPVFTLFNATVRLTPEEESLFTPVTPILVTDVTVGSARFAFRLFSVGLLRAGFVAVMFKPRGEDGVSFMNYVDVFLLTTII